MEQPDIRPPKRAVRFLRFYCKEELIEEIEGDLREEFAERFERLGGFRARFIYWLQVLSFLRPFAVKRITLFNPEITWSMLIHYLKVALRNFNRQKLAVGINIFSLTMGIACTLLIYLFIQNEWSYDQFHENKEQLYRVNRMTYNKQGAIMEGIEAHPVPMAPTLQELYPEVLKVCRLYDDDNYIRYGNTLIEQKQYFVDSTFFELFSFPLISGDPSSVLIGQNKVTITQELAQKLFGKLNPIGQTVEIYYRDQFYPFEVVGLLENIPANSTLEFDMLLPYSFFAGHGFAARYKDSWNLSFVRTFALLAPDTDIKALEEKTVQMCNQYFTYRKGIEERYGEESYYGESFQPIEDIHFETLVESDLNEAGDRKHSYILGGIGLIILLIACINFTILAIGRSAGRMKEIGIRKVVGAQKKQLQLQFLGESLLMSFMGLLFGVIITQLILPQFNELSNRSLTIQTLLHPISILFVLGSTLVTGLMAGLYPALILSNYQPVKSLMARFRLGGSNRFTRSLVTVQFVLSTVLVVVTLVMADQLRFMKMRDLGFDQEMLMVVRRQGQDRSQFFSAFKNGLANDPNVLAVTTTTPALTHGAYRSSFEHEGSTIEYFITFVESNYLETMGIDLLAGRDFRAGSTLDSTENILINQAFADALGWEDPIGRKVTGLDNAGYSEPVVIGVTDNFHFQSLENEVAPMWMILSDESSMNDIVVRVNPVNAKETIQKMEGIWKNLATDYPFTYTFLDDDMAALYQAQERWSRIVSLSGFLAILIAFMGMYGLIALSVAGRTKELSIRKVLGASLQRIVFTLTGPFARMVGIALIIALPLAWYLAIQWLNSFAYHITFRPVVVLLAFGIIWGMFLVAVSFHIWRSSRLDPVEFLRSE